MQFLLVVAQVKNATTGEFVLERDTPPGVYQYKFIVDGKWTLVSTMVQCMAWANPCSTMRYDAWCVGFRMANPDLPSVTDNGTWAAVLQRKSSLFVVLAIVQA